MTETPTEQHGTPSAYKRELRLGQEPCAACRAANAEAWAEDSKRWEGKPLPAGVEHGDLKAYRYYRCHCPPCRAANAARVRRTRTPRGTA